jgi:hypothetical protein
LAVLAFGLLLSGQPARLAAAESPRVPEVWFGPAPSSPDYLRLFTEPAAWRRARAKVKAFLFSTQAAGFAQPGQPNTLADLTRVDAFRKVKEWGLATAIEAPSVRGWDCSGRRAAAITEKMIDNIIAAGGSVDIVSLDEPLSSGFPRGSPSCKLSDAAIAATVAGYIQTVKTSPGLASRWRPPEFVDIEPYPGISADDLAGWVRELLAHGVRLAGLTLDVDMNLVQQSTERLFRLVPDLQRLHQVLQRAGVAFGIILWSGHDPLRTDQIYYNFTMDWSRIVHRALGRPEYVVFESWVTRCSLSGVCSATHCTAADPPYCGEKSIPLNLPEDDINIASHTRLINHALASLEMK